MTRRKIASESTGTSTTAAERATQLLSPARALAIAGCVCAAVVWSAGPPGRLVVVLPLLLFAPGYLIERSLRLPPPTTAFLRPALWLGLSLSSVALIYQWATALGLALTPPVLGALALACGVGVLWRFWIDGGRQTKGQRPKADDTKSAWSSVIRPWSLALIAVLALALWVRFYEIRALALPAWVDSVHHALLIRVAAEHGQAPISVQPYLPIDQIPYHWGYHVFVAAAMGLSGADLPLAMLWSGQVLNGLHVLTVAALAAYLWRRPVAGLAAGIVVGCVSIWPAYYVSWGRYTQLAGLLLLPPLMVAWSELLRAPRRRITLVVALLLAGMSLIHMIVVLMALCFMALSSLYWALGYRRQPALQVTTPSQGATGHKLAQQIRAAIRSASATALWHRATPALASGGLALVLVAPWLASLLARTLTPAYGRSQPLAATGSSYYALDQGLLWAGLNRWLVALALLAALVAMRRHWPVAAVQIGWVGALVVLANPWLALFLLPAAGAGLLAWAVERRSLPAAAAGLALIALNPRLVSLPYLAIFTNEVVVISLFIPIAVLIGGGAALLWGDRVTEPSDQESASDMKRDVWPSVLDLPSLRRAALSLALVASTLWGTWNLRNVVNPGTVFATPADVAAIEWATAHTPPDARFLINAAPWLGTGRGADGGWWLLPLAGRWTSTPPVIYDFGPSAYANQTRANTRIVQQFKPGQEQQIYDLIDREQITYIYLGPRSKPLTSALFADQQRFEKMYDRDGVLIFAVRRRASDAIIPAG
jgi:hypothetical protein